MSEESAVHKLEAKIIALEAELDERKENETTLLDSLARLQALSKATFEGILLSENGVIIDHNQTAARMLRYDPNDGVGRNLLEGIVPEDHEVVMEHIRLGRDGPYEVTALRKDGTTFPCEIQARMSQMGGRPVRVTAFRDITERKEVEAELRESEARFNDVADMMPQPIWEVDLNGRFVFTNRAGYQAFGYSQDDLDGGVTVQDVVVPKDRERVAKAFEKVMKGEPSSEHEYTALRKDGTEFPILTYMALMTKDGQPTGMRGSSVEISRRKQAEEEKIILERRVQQAQKLESLGVLAGGIAHDFNNLLVGILGNADLSLDMLSDMSPVRDQLRDIVESSKRAADLSNQMLAYSGKGRFLVVPIDIRELVEESGALLRGSVSKKAVFIAELGENLPAFNGDVSQIRQVLINLMTNASEALGDESGIITLSTGVMECDREYFDGLSDVMHASLGEPLSIGQYVYLEVTDTGSGMDPKTVDKIFDPFFSTKFTGRGLGMSAVLGIVSGHRGAIRIDTEIGRGTTVRVVFPANKPTNGVTTAGECREVRIEDWRPTGTVLLVDDEAAVCTVGKRMLERFGFSVLTAGDGREAVEVHREHADELVCVLLDLTMPELDGVAAFDEMYCHDSEIPVVLSSGFAENDATEQFAGKDLAGFIQKPFKMATLKAKLFEVLVEGE